MSISFCVGTGTWELGRILGVRGILLLYFGDIYR
ncbi:hypothetical protein HMPREF9470_03754 [[Clostridium] citroniae WAL-19142]|uniref:Uncharacterized protein n=2 Tax=Enterocloster citroniae TaxID=358743 RepID=A0ABV2FUS0_9FIRM|nr:hypothetical protein HMPREF9470_03754 [[Clostridium] citroniae WAL-19142]